MTHAARKTVRMAIEQEVLNAELQRKQAEVVMREKMHGMAKLVAGVSHELNSPLGVMQSGLDTQATALKRLDGKVSGKDAKALKAALAVGATLGEAAQRISATAASLRNFAHLDEAAPVDLDQSQLRGAAPLVGLPKKPGLRPRVKSQVPLGDRGGS